MEELHRGDCREFLKTLPESSVDAAVTDPPYELNFMGREWDRTGIAFDPSFWAELLRVLKPGGHLLAAGIGRTHHRMMVAVEDAGFEIRDCIYHIFGSGFPKNLDVSKAIDRLMMAERPVIGTDAYRAQRMPHERSTKNTYSGPDRRTGTDFVITAPATEEAAKWEGWGTSLKPAVEIWTLARKPLSEGSVAGNILRWGTGAINIDQCRIAYREDDSWHSGIVKQNIKVGTHVYDGGWSGKGAVVASPFGRWPTNLVLTHSVECSDACTPGCPVRLLNEQNNDTDYGDSGGASRFFYCAKVSPDERWGFCRDCNRAVSPEELDAHRAEKHRVTVHPTQKPLELMRWLVRLVTPPGGTVLDPFAGSGTTLVAAVLEGFEYIGAEADPEYAEIAEARLLATRKGKAPPILLKGGLEQLTLF